MRMLSPIFGVTVYAVGTTLAVFMLGLAIGSAVLGRLSDKSRNPVLLYIILVIGICLYTAIVPWLMDVVKWAFVNIHTHFKLSLTFSAIARFLLCIAGLLLPTILMGGTLPVLSRYVAVLRDEVGQSAGYLYGINTLGAVVGTVCAGFVLIDLLGVSETNWLAVALYVLSALFALPASMAEHPKLQTVQESVGRKTEPKPQIPLRRLALIAATGSGFAALIYEVVWTRIIALMSNVTVYSFSGVLAAFLTGLAIGSVVSSRLLVRREATALYFALVQAGIGLYAVLTPTLFELAGSRFTDLQINWNYFDGNFLLFVFAQFILMFCMLIVPTFLMGAAFPLACCLASAGSSTAGLSVGAVSAWNTVGGALGSVAGAFVFIPLIGLKGTLIAAAAINFILFGVLTFVEQGVTRHVKTLVATFVGLGLLVSIGTLGKNITFRGMSISGTERIIWHYEGPEGVVEVIRNEQHGTLGLRSNRTKYEGSNEPIIMQMYRRQFYLPLLLHPDPEEVLVLGMGTGVSVASAIADDRVKRVDIVEISRGIVKAARLFFGPHNLHAADTSKGTLFLDDARNHVLLYSHRYDVIVADLFFPNSPGVGSLYTVEHYNYCRKRLKPGGLMCQWVPLHQVDEEELAAIMRSFSKVFPHVSVWVYEKYLALIGLETPMEIDVERFVKAFKRQSIKADLARHRLEDPVLMLSGFVMADSDVTMFTGKGPLNTDNHPFVEFHASRHFHLDHTATLYLENRSRLDKARRPIYPYLKGPNEMIQGLRVVLEACLDACDLFMLTLQRHRYSPDRDSFIRGLCASMQRYENFLPPRVVLAESYMQMAQLCAKSGDYEAAIEATREAAKLHPWPAAVCNNMGWAAFYYKSKEEARKWFRQAIKMDPENTIAESALKSMEGVDNSHAITPAESAF